MARLRVIVSGPLLKELRVEKGFRSQEELAFAAEIDVKTIGRIEQNSGWRVNAETFQSLARALSMAPAELHQRIDRYLKQKPIITQGAIVQAAPKRQDMTVRSLLADIDPRVQESGPLWDQVRLTVAGFAWQARDNSEIKDALERARRFGNSTGLLELIERDLKATHARFRDIHLKRAAISLLIGDVNRAAESVSAILQAALHDAEAMNLSAHIERLRGNLDGAERVYQQVLRLKDDGPERMDALSGLGIIHRDRGQLDDARKYHEQALAVAEQLRIIRRQADEHRYLGTIARRQIVKTMPETGELNKAQLHEPRNHYANALRLYRSLGDKIGIADTLDHIGVLHLTTRSSRTAERWHRRALNIHRQIRRRVGMAFAMGNLVMALGEQGKINEAIRWAHATIRIYRKMGWQEQLARAHGNLAECYSRASRIGLSLRHWKQARAIFEKLGMSQQRQACDMCIKKLVDTSVQDPYMA